MFSFLFILLAAAGGVIIALSLKQGRVWGVVAGCLWILASIALFGIMDVWGDLLWFRNLGYGGRFWTALSADVLITLVAGLVGGGLVAALTWRATQGRPGLRYGGLVLAVGAGALWGHAQWDTVLKFIHRAPIELKDPIFQRSADFYLFVLPLLNAVYAQVLFMVLIGLAIVGLTVFRLDMRQGNVDLSPGAHDAVKRHGMVAVAAVFAVLAVGRFLARYDLLYSDRGVFTGPGWTDIHVRLPSLTILAVLLLIAAAAILIPSVRGFLGRPALKFGLTTDSRLTPLGPAVTAAGLIALVWFAGLGILPGLVQSLVIEPNEISLEKPYIRNNIQFTRYAFNLHQVEEREFPASDQPPPRPTGESQRLYDNIRLWDWRALDSVYQQFQEIRLYYEFTDVDVDRYTIQGEYRQMMISAREMEPDNLPPDSQTFVNRRFKYTHGYGLTLTDVSEFTTDGLPDLLIKDIPPKSRYPELAVERPQIYYGELTDGYVVVNSQEEEFDYPSGERNVYIRYPGKGGVLLDSFWRRLIYAYKFGGVKFLLSSYPTAESRIMFHRRISERVQKLAPFLRFDNDPYVVLAEGRLYWVIDAYTTSDAFPYSSRFTSAAARQGKQPEALWQTGLAGSLGGVNYVRNAVKAVVDAFDGSVHFYVFDPEDGVIQTWSRIYQGLFQPSGSMPAALRRHVRYPADMLVLQGEVYAKYHMTDPTVFYNQEDLWVRATEKYYNQVQAVEPYYIMWQQPGRQELAFVLMLPFTPKNRQVMIGWIAGMCDGKDYGRFLAYKFPKEKRVLGPQQVETKIDQDSYLSGQLSLWDQRGSNVIRGNVLAIPVGETIVYVEPIYLQAETAAYPELRLVAVMHQDTLSYAETFDRALAGLFGDQPAIKAEAGPARGQATGKEADVQALIRQANRAFNDYLRQLGDKQFNQASRSLTALQQNLEQLAGLSPGGTDAGLPPPEKQGANPPGAAADRQ